MPSPASQPLPQVAARDLSLSLALTYSGALLVEQALETGNEGDRMAAGHCRGQVPQCVPVVSNCNVIVDLYTVPLLRTC